MKSLDNWEYVFTGEDLADLLLYLKIMLGDWANSKAICSSENAEIDIWRWKWSKSSLCGELYAEIGKFIPEKTYQDTGEDGDWSVTNAIWLDTCD